MTARASLSEKFQTVGLGFWLYLMTDMMLFASLFATYMVLKSGTADGPAAHDLFDPQYALIETLLLLTSSFMCGLAYLAARRKNRQAALSFLFGTLLLGVGFLWLEVQEFHAFAAAGHSWQTSAFLSGFFTLVGTHGAHIAIGLIWGLAITSYLLLKGISDDLLRKFSMFALFWHFLDVVWIFIFTIVYLLGAAS